MSQRKFELYTKQSSLALLKELSLAQAFNPLQREALADCLKAFNLHTDMSLIEEGKPNDNLYFICHGSFNVIKMDADKQIKILQTLTPGKIVGEGSFFDHDLCSATVKANEPAVVLSLARDDFMHLSQEAPHCALALCLEMFRLLSQRLRHVSGAMVNLL